MRDRKPTPHDHSLHVPTRVFALQQCKRRRTGYTTLRSDRKLVNARPLVSDGERVFAMLHKRGREALSCGAKAPVPTL